MFGKNCAYSHTVELKLCNHSEWKHFFEASDSIFGVTKKCWISDVNTGSVSEMWIVDYDLFTGDPTQLWKNARAPLKVVSVDECRQDARKTEAHRSTGPTDPNQWSLSKRNGRNERKSYIIHQLSQTTRFKNKLLRLLSTSLVYSLVPRAKLEL